MNAVEDLLGNLVSGALGGNLTDADRRRLTILWTVSRAWPNRHPAELLLAADWVLDLADEEVEDEAEPTTEEADHTARHSTGDVDERFVDVRDGHLRGARPSWVVVDEVQEWTNATPSTLVPEVDLTRLRRVVTEARRLSEFLDVAHADGEEFDNLVRGLRDAAIAALAAGSTEYGFRG